MHSCACIWKAPLRIDTRTFATNVKWRYIRSNRTWRNCKMKCTKLVITQRKKENWPISPLKQRFWIFSCKQSFYLLQYKTSDQQKALRCLQEEMMQSLDFVLLKKLKIPQNFNRDLVDDGTTAYVVVVFTKSRNLKPLALNTNQTARTIYRKNKVTV